MPLIETKGAASAQGFGEFAQSGAVNYIEDVFSTYLYTGNGSTQTITNGIDLSTKGGLVWMKSRSAATDHALYDTVRGATKDLVSNSQAAETTQSTGLTSFASTGFSIGALAKINTNAATYVSWTFREQPKFFDVVTYSGNNVAGRTIAHSLGSEPGVIIVKKTNDATGWVVYHRSLGATKIIQLESTLGATTFAGAWNNTAPTSSVFTVGNDNWVNLSGGTYVAYLFAHNAGGFGLSGSDNVISCGSMTSTGSLQQVTLGYEPQWVMIKNATSTGNWEMADVMRGMYVDDDGVVLRANSSAAEIGPFTSGVPGPTATGFQFAGASGDTYIYIAIRRGPMKVPTSGTSVYNAIAYTGNDASNRQITGLGFPPDLALVKARDQVRNYGWEDRLRGADTWLVSSGTNAESSYSGFGAGGPFLQNGITVGANGLTNEAPTTYILQAMRRAPGFFDEVCYTGTGVGTTTKSHNLGVVPELMIVKCRDTAYNWAVYSFSLGNTKYLELSNTTAVQTDTAIWNSTTPTSTVFSTGLNSLTNGGGATYVAYLFATCAGVSKVGSYTGTGTTLQVNCGFTGGSRFVLIKRTDSTGDWYVWDSARGIVAGNDPYLLLNSTAAEVTGTDYVDTYSAGFEISSTAPAAINANGGTFIFLAIA